MAKKNKKSKGSIKQAYGAWQTLVKKRDKAKEEGNDAAVSMWNKLIGAIEDSYHKEEFSDKPDPSQKELKKPIEKIKKKIDGIIKYFKLNEKSKNK